MSKGSTARPIPDRKTFESNWDAIFKKKEPERISLCPDCNQPNKDLIHTCSPQLKETK
jgi:hypothetical protein